MPKGKIKLVSERGYGFIRTAEGKDIYFHRKELEGVDYDSLREGKEVEFEIGKDRIGRPQAGRVRLAPPKAA